MSDEPPIPNPHDSGQSLDGMKGLLEGLLYPALAALALFVVFLLAGAWAAGETPLLGEKVLTLFKDTVLSELEGDSPGILCIKIFLNNLQANLLIFLGGATFGILTALIIAVNGIVIGAVASVVAEKKSLLVLCAGIAPHGVIEIPAVILSSALGFRLALALLDEIMAGGDAAGRAVHLGKVFIIVIIPLIALAAVVEAFITPEIIRLVA